MNFWDGFAIGYLVGAVPPVLLLFGALWFEAQPLRK
jgi:hypothetical protein